jgi:hypothetical protein
LLLEMLENKMENETSQNTVENDNAG